MRRDGEMNEQKGGIDDEDGMTDKGKREVGEPLMVPFYSPFLHCALALVKVVCTPIRICTSTISPTKHTYIDTNMHYRYSLLTLTLPSILDFFCSEPVMSPTQPFDFFFSFFALLLLTHILSFGAVPRPS